MLLLKGFASFVSVALNSSALPWPAEEAARNFQRVVTRQLLSVDPEFHRLGIFLFTEFYIF